MVFSQSPSVTASTIYLIILTVRNVFFCSNLNPEIPISLHLVPSREGETAGHLWVVLCRQSLDRISSPEGFQKFLIIYASKNKTWSFSSKFITGRVSFLCHLLLSCASSPPGYVPVSCCHHHGTPGLLLCSALHLMFSCNCKLLESKDCMTPLSVSCKT